jgi:two-component system chemotaxis response regulator CheB
MAQRLKVLIVDDSAFFRNRVSDALKPAEDIEIVGIATNGQEAIEKVKRLKPDVVTMDVEMPVVDGISAVRSIMAEAPTRILMFSALTKEGAKETMEALEAGALDFLPKDMQGVREAGKETKTILLERVRAVAKARLPYKRTSGASYRPAVVRTSSPQPGTRGGQKPSLIAIGASTGGPVALREVLMALPRNFSLPVVVAVHMPASFTKAFADRLNSTCAVDIAEAVDREPLRPGRVLVAPGGKQMTVERGPAGHVVRISEPLSGQIYRPSVDLLLSSIASGFNGNTLAIVLTGMGSDGKEGAKQLKQKGADVWSQDEKSCVVYGMPQAVASAGLSDRVLSLDEIGPSLARVV